MRVFDRGAGPVEMIYIPRSTFTMGYDGGELERPSHDVTLKPYWIDKTEVTIAQYKRCLKAKKCKRHSRIAKDLSKKSIQLKMLSSMCNRRYKDRDQHPVNCVSYKRASTFCKFRGARLPTEAEWEYAARGSKGRTLPWGAGAPTCNRAVVNDDGYGCGRVSTWAVGSKKNGISPFGLHDTMGNVAEWVKDWHGPYTPLPEFNPRGPRKSEAEIPLRVYRGGGMLENTNVWPRVTMRRGIEPRTRRPDLGFRCAKRAI